MQSVATLEALGTPYEIQPAVLADCKRFDPDMYSDFYKVANGVRPRFGLGDRTAEQLDALWDRTIAEAIQAGRDEGEREAAAVTELDRQISDMIALGAGDVITAIRWIVDASDWDDLDMVLHDHGIFECRNLARFRGMARHGA